MEQELTLRKSPPRILMLVLRNSMDITRGVRRDVGRSWPGRINEQMRRRAVNLGAARSLHEGRIVARKSSQEPKLCTRSTKSARHYPGKGCLPGADRGE